MNFKEIIVENKKNIKSIIKKFTGCENEDLEQEVYIRVLTSKKYEEKGKFKPWINKIAANISKDYLKSSAVKNECLTENDKEDIFYQIKDKKGTPETKLISLERQKRILAAIDELKPKLREVIYLVEIENFSYNETAKKLNCPEGTIKSRLYNAKSELAKKLQDLL